MTHLKTFNQTLVRLLCVVVLVASIVGCSAPVSEKYKRLKERKSNPNAQKTPNPVETVSPEVKKAEAEVKTAKGDVEKDPYSADKHYQLAKAYMKRGKIAEAVDEYQNTIRLNKQHTEAFLDLARLALLLKKHNDLKGLTDAVLRLQPRNAEAHQLRAISAKQRGLINEAIKEWQTALSLAANSREDIAPRRALLELYTGMRDYNTALKLCDESLKKHPTNEYFFIWKGDLLGKMGDRPAAIKIYDQAVAKLPKSAEIRRRIVELYLSRRIEPERSLKYAQQVVALTPKDPRAYELIGRVYLSQNKLDDALASFEQAQKLVKGPVNPILANRIATTLMAKNEFGKAEKVLQSVVSAHPKKPQPLLMLAGFYVSQRKFKEALEQYDKAMPFVSDQSDQTTIRDLKGQVYTLQDDRSSAIREYEAVIRMKPEATAVANNLAYLYAQEKTHLDEALRLAEKANKASKEKHPGILDTVGYVHLQREDYDNALKYFTLAKDKMAQAINSNPKIVPNPTILYHLGVAYGKKGKKQEAISTLEESLQAGEKIKSLGGEFKEEKDAASLLQELKGA
jgi:tetratricopeptide (TPR) repeat protein